jgi:UDP-3-O-[3-hydroxymyristoyl] glucosamine N-acyltransferase
MAYLLSHIAELLGGRHVGDDVEITGLATLVEAEAGDLAFLESTKYLPQARDSGASALLVPPDLEVADRPAVLVPNPRIAFAHALSLFNGHAPPEPSVHPTAVLEDGATVSPTAAVMAFSFVGKDSVIGDRAVIHPLVHVGRGVTVGADTVLYPHVTVYDRVTLGERVRVHSGSVLGADGFGYEVENGEHLKVPHIGTVVIEDDVEIGALCAVDRAKTGATRIGRGSKIDNLVQIGHNVRIGEHCLIVAQVGLGGSVELGDYVALAGQAGVADHNSIGKGARVGAKSGVISDVSPGEVVAGFPARPHKQWLRTKAAQNRVPDLLVQVREMEQRIRDLEAKLAARETPNGE